MRITESQLRRVIREVIEEIDQSDIFDRYEKAGFHTGSNTSASPRKPSPEEIEQLRKNYEEEEQRAYEDQMARGYR